MKVIERFIEGKAKYGRPCEDAIFFSTSLAAVIDGATDKTGRTVAGVSGGVFASHSILKTLEALDPRIGIVEFAEALSSGLAKDIAREAPDLDPRTEDGPSATIVAYSAARREVWRVGDTSWATTESTMTGSRAFDRAAARARSALLRARIRMGATIEMLQKDDAGRAFILPMLTLQHVFRNLQDPTEPFSFGSIDGNPVPAMHLECWPIPDATELVLASDGYPRVFGTLMETEAYLKADIKRDPLRIGRHPSTKGVAPDATSFDDRAYLRLAL